MWSTVLTLAGASSYYLATRKMIAAYYLGLSTQIVWVLYAINTQQWPFLGSAALFTTINALGLRRARAERNTQPMSGACPTVEGT